MTTADRVLSVLSLFTVERPEWTVDAVAAALQLSSSTAYQYVRSLADADLLVAGKVGRYTIGPAVIALDRVTRRFDPLIVAAREPLRQLTRSVDGEAIGLLCRVYRLKVMCVDQYTELGHGLSISYERGRPMPFVRGAASKIILANLPLRRLRRFYESDPALAEGADLGSSWQEFRRTMRALARSGVALTAGELDTGVVGIAAPVFATDGEVVGSISLVTSREVFASNPQAIDAAKDRVRSAGETVTCALSEERNQTS